MNPHRLFATRGPSLPEHQQRYGPVTGMAAPALVALLDQSGLTGRGGAGFPTGRKIASVTGRRPVVIGNGAEGEPLSSKDATLLCRAPHLVLDGLSIAATALASDDVYIYVPQHVGATVQIALDERAAAKTDRTRITVIERS